MKPEFLARKLKPIRGLIRHEYGIFIELLSVQREAEPERGIPYSVDDLSVQHS